MSKADQILKIVAFIESIGINVQEGQVSAQSFLPGVEIVQGALVYDANALHYPGDLLHEAGHIALVPGHLRKQLSGNVTDLKLTDGGEEMGVMLWTYAACCFMKISPEHVFHSGGYHGQSQWLLDNYASGNYIGLPLLQWMGMCEKEADAKSFPNMIKWMRD
ncbi:MAG: hypothetical protein IPL65_09985 [Lewinellaceae bacterium]|nr:hypothetical protein [Lewinellaceae bacterium]